MNLNCFFLGEHRTLNGEGETTQILKVEENLTLKLRLQLFLTHSMSNLVYLQPLLKEL